MPIKYKGDILAMLKEKGYNTTTLRREKLLAEGVIQSLRGGKYISMDNLPAFVIFWSASPPI